MMRGKLRKTSVGSAGGRKNSSTLSLGVKINGNILILGERIRLAFHHPKIPLVKDRRKHFRLFQQCFVGKDAVDWLLQQRHATDRKMATQLMQVLLKDMLIHNALEDSEVFSDDDSIYRFCMDENSFPLTRETEPFIKGEQVFSRLSADPNDTFELVKVHAENGVTYEKSFFGTELTAWLMRNRYCQNRQQAIMFGKDLLENRIIRHVTNDHHFKDERLLYEFDPIMSNLKFSDLLELDSDREEQLNSAGPNSPHVTSPLTRKLSTNSPGLPRNFSEPHRLQSSPRGRRVSDLNGFKTAMSDSEDHGFEPLMLHREGMLQQRRKASSVSDSSSDRCSPPPNPHSPSVLAGDFAGLEIRDTDEGFTKETIQIQGDSVGYGFIIRGNGPVFVKAVDPGGPAAQAGLKVQQFIESVNGINVLNMTHQEAAQVIIFNETKALGEFGYLVGKKLKICDS